MKVRFSPLTPVTCPAHPACDGQRGCRCAEHNTNKHWLHSHVFQKAAAHAGASDLLLVYHDIMHRQCHHSWRCDKTWNHTIVCKQLPQEKA